MYIEVFLKKAKNIFWFKTSVLLVAYAVFAFLALRGLILKTGAIGHNWDWVVPLPTENLVFLAEDSVYVWKELSLGFDKSITVVQSMFHAIAASPAYLGFDGAFVSKSLVFSSITMSGTTMFYLIEDIITNEFNHNNEKNLGSCFFSAFLAGYFYALSPFLFNTIIAGSTAEFVAYSILPLAICVFRKTVRSQEREKMKCVILLAILLSLITICSQVLFLTSAIMILYAFAYKNRHRLIKDLLEVGVVYSLLNLYWIVPVLFHMGSVVEIVSPQKNPFMLKTIEGGVPSLASVFIATGYFRPFFSRAIDPTIRSLWLLCSFCMVSFMLLTISSKKNRESLFWMSLLLISFALATGAKAPLGGLVLWMYKCFPPMVLFRSPQHWMVLPTFCLAIILGIGIFYSLIRSNLGITIVFFILLTLWVSPFFTGNLGWNYLGELGGGNNVSTYQLSPGYKEVLDRVNSSEEYYRVLYLPMTYSPYYLKTEYQEEGQGGDPLITFSVKPAVVAHGTRNSFAAEFTSALENILCGESPPRCAAKLLAFANVKYIVLRKDVRPNEGPIAIKWNYSQVFRNLEEINEVRLIGEYDYVSLWENQYSLPHIYGGTNIVLVDEKNDDFADIVCKVNSPISSMVFLQTSQLDSSGFQLIQSCDLVNYTHPSEMRFKRINQTKYLVHINSTRPFVLVFCEAYDSGWKAYVKDEEIALHLVANGYANAWILDKTGSYDVTLEFIPQRWFYTGSMVSLVVLAACVTYFCRDRTGRLLYKCRGESESRTAQTKKKIVRRHSTTYVKDRHRHLGI